MNRYIRLLLSRFNKSVSAFVFVSDSEDCPCMKTFELVKDDKSINTICFINPDGPDAVKMISKLKVFRNLVVFMHGDEQRKKFFYLHFNPHHNRSFRRNIDDEWISVLRKKERNIYFHVCNGAEILRSNSTIQPLIDKWVAHTNKVYGFNSTNPKIRAIRKKFFRQMHEEISSRHSPRSMESAVLASYYSIKGDLHDLSAKDDPVTNCNKAYVINVIINIGKNIQSLSTSES